MGHGGATGPGGRRGGRFLRLLLLGAAGAVLLASPAARGQETYKLGDSGQWQKQAAPAPGTPEFELLAIRKLIAEGDGQTAYAQATEWIDKRPNHPLLVEAYLLRGDAQVVMRSYYESLMDYEKVIRRYPASEAFNTALEREYEIARLFAAGVKKKFLGWAIVPAYEDAEEIYIRIQERVPGSDLGEKASLALADYYFEWAEMTQASEAYDLFLLNYPRSQQRERAMLRLIQANLATFQGPKFDPKGLIEAAQRLRMYQREYPAAAERIGAEGLITRIEESLGRKTLYTAQWYEGQGDRVSAVYMYQRTVRDYPRTAAARSALDRLAAMKAPPVSAALDPAVSLPRAAATQPASQPAKGVRP